MKIALTGATGFVGQAVLDAADGQTVQLNALTRRPQSHRDGVKWLEGSLSDKDSLMDLVRGSDAVIHVAGLTNAPDPSHFHAANVVGTQTLIRACQDSDVARFVFVSSLSAREPELSRYGASKVEAEKWVGASGLDWTIVRPPAVYGPRDIDMFELFRSARLGIVPVPPRGRTSIIHVEDLAACLLSLAEAGDETYRTILEPDDGKPGGYEHGELARLIGRAVGRKVWAPHLPEWMLKLGARGDRLVRGDAAKLTLDRVGYMTHPDWVCSPERAVPDAIWQPAIGGVEGLRSTAGWYQREGWL